MEDKLGNGGVTWMGVGIKSTPSNSTDQPTLAY